MRIRNNYFILRHGETLYQTKKKGLIYPWPDNSSVKLTEKGKAQIKKAAKLLRKEKVDLIFSSDFFRTRQTAGIVAKELGKKIIFDKRLRDINLGVYHGKSKEEFYKDLPRRSGKRFYQRPLQGESWQDCQKRMVSFLRDVDKKHKNKIILIISHGDPLWLLEGAVNNYTPDKLLIKKEGNYIKVGELRKLNITETGFP